MDGLTYADSFDVLVLQAAADGRGEVLFGDSPNRVRESMHPFLLGTEFPDIYFEFPLVGSPFMDVTVLYSSLGANEHIDSPAAMDTDRLLGWFHDVSPQYAGVSFGFELDTSKTVLPAAAIHFQPRAHHELVTPFFEVIGEPERAQLYLDLAKRMPAGWPLSFFGLFRGRPNAPLRVCGYLSPDEKYACAHSPARLGHVFDDLGFTAYDQAVLDQACDLMALAPGVVDFQFDVLPDGSLGDTFALDLQFGIQKSAVVKKEFTEGQASRVMRRLQELGAADERWRLAVQASFSRALPLQRADGSTDSFGFTLLPQWAKARWRAGVLQPSKLYFLGNAGFLD